MSSMRSKDRINKILFITLSNIGDVILSLPVLDALKESFAQSEITVMVGPRPKEILENNPRIDRLIIYDKYAKLRDKIRLFRELSKEKFDLVIDLRNSLYGALLPARYRTSPFLSIPRRIQHMKERNLYRLQKALKNNNKNLLRLNPGMKLFSGSVQDTEYIATLLKNNGIVAGDKIIIISPGAGGDTRRWEAGKFAKLSSQLGKDYKIILVGTHAHQPVTQYIYKNCPNKIFDFTGLTNLRQLAALLKRAAIMITPDTGTLQLASYLDTPTVALFGPSDEKRYGPWPNKFRVVKKDIFCRPCAKAHCRFGTVRCLRLVKVEDVLAAVKETLSTNYKAQGIGSAQNFKRILIVRTDRIGDVLLSTPVIKALRQNYPSAYLAMMVSPYTKDIVEGNPYLDEVIIYDKDNKHKNWLTSLVFARDLKKEAFDLALILHPTNRVHLVTFLAGIPKRVGFKRKLGFLLTDKIEHTKQSGEKHELEYTLDLVRSLGIIPEDKSLLMPINPESEQWTEELLKQEGIGAADKLLAIHPGASCPSKIWPNERFAEVADRLSEKYGLKVLVIAGTQDAGLALQVIQNMHFPALNLAGRASLSQLASLLKRCRLLISNDSGPIHIAAALNTPVISIFGRNQKGLSPKRWGPPAGGRNFVLHKQVGCLECLAHSCVKEFACLKAISVEDVVKAAETMLNESS